MYELEKLLSTISERRAGIASPLHLSVDEPMACRKLRKWQRYSKVSLETQQFIFIRLISLFYFKYQRNKKWTANQPVDTISQRWG